jgi:hypothetical protein
MKNIILLSFILLFVVIFGCKQNITEPEEIKETYIGYAVGDSGKVLKSTDGGKNWDLKPTGTLTQLNSIYSFSPSVAIAVGNNGVIIKTVDGGNSWSIQNSNTSVNLKKISFNVQTNQCWIVGEQGVLLNANNYY